MPLPRPGRRHPASADGSPIAARRSARGFPAAGPRPTTYSPRKHRAPTDARYPLIRARGPDRVLHVRPGVSPTEARARRNVSTKGNRPWWMIVASLSESPGEDASLAAPQGLHARPTPPRQSRRSAEI
ncbi:hypothetical protein A33M_3066 [Rhodovulum sp. PH10]|nr:hypothetical protein A33M_3066 [Rhodovulum sp. PH10]